MSYFDDVVIPLWVVIYDDSPSQTYVFTSTDKVLASVEGSVRQISAGLAEQDNIDKCTTEFIKELHKQMAICPFIPMKFDDLDITVVRLELDKHNSIFQLISDCHTYITDQERQTAIPWPDRSAILNKIEDCFKRPL